MKNFVFIILIISLLSACNSLVNEKAFDKLTTGNFFKTPEDIQTAVNGVYDGIQGGQPLRWQALMDGGIPGSIGHYWSPDLVTLHITNTTPSLWTLWNSYYVAIGRANLVLAQLKNTKVDPSIKARDEAQVRFIRAFCYFNLVREFGHIPLSLKSPTSLSEVVLPDTTADPDAFQGQFFKQRDRMAVYDAIIQDLKYAQANLPDSYEANNEGRVTKGASTGMLAKVYLTLAGKFYDYNTGDLKQGDPIYYDSAAAECKKIITSGKDSLLSDYFNIFNPETKYNSEVIFAIQHISSSVAGVTGEGNLLAAYEGIKGASITPYSYKQFYVSDPFYNDWVKANGKSDKRFSTTFITSFVNSKGDTVKVGDLSTFLHPAIRKFLGKLPEGPNAQVSAQNAGDYGSDWIVLRYADVLLMYSEALNNINGPTSEALEGINKVRKRAGKSAITLPLSKEALADSIFEERKWELCYEGHYYFDCQRSGRLLDEIAKSPSRLVPPSKKLYVMPLPFQALQENPSLVQNEGW